ncbi:hypothetical protein HKX54_14735 [Sulfitobacter sp. M57]|uniref:hypothetical protein n=1 Tax=unclassified Sulfitobacter TaxID=196795 RepID=UPI0023E13659|nr:MULTISPECIES: hypothetical protein [unclassified Sulfitobacter]MDF3415727.1 hypothetical protein [Sulfitobacter sp. KE5]MDF3423207.1 hypothetical protein [Sulfitobacter sp. KE43]MDF3434273.1 hypothetical protein [Sulfitobacter sp. KE42]MDF3459694.1 hypothetical protein [Sulfitobacter sp. S74]MDF3463811.1 hypothetical protein [Sulfitobacter sp. Ks18]
MSKEVEKLKEHVTKKIKDKLKKFSPVAGEKMKKALLANLDDTWAKEDKLQEAIQEIKLGGMPGKKTDDFLKHKDAAGPRKTWEAALKKHRKGLDDFKKFQDQATVVRKDLEKQVALAEKSLKKAGGKPDKTVAKDMAEARKALADITTAEKLYGGLEGFVVMYGMIPKRTNDAIVKQAIEAVTPKEFPEPLTAKNRDATEKRLKKDAKSLDGLCDSARDLIEAGDLKAAKGYIKKAEMLVKKLKPWAKDAKTASTKMKAEIKANEDAKAIDALIKKMTDTYKDGESQIEELTKELKIQENAK